jgi:hypothetical protein
MEGWKSRRFADKEAENAENAARRMGWNGQKLHVQYKNRDFQFKHFVEIAC